MEDGWLGAVDEDLQLAGSIAASEPTRAGQIFSRSLAKAERARDELGGPPDDAMGSLLVAVELQSRAGLAIVLDYQGRVAEAKAAYERSLHDFERFDTGNGQYAATLDAYGDFLTDQGEHGAALRALERARDVLDVESDPAPDIVRRVLLRLGQAFLARQQFERALDVYTDLVDLARATDPGSESTAIALGDMAWAHFDLGDLAGARPLWEEALALLERLDSPSTETAKVHNALGELTYKEAITGQLGEDGFDDGLRRARRHFEVSLEILDDSELDPRSRATALYNLGAVVHLSNEDDLSRRCFATALSTLQQHRARDSRSIEVRVQLGRAMVATGSREEGIEALREAVDLTESMRAASGGGDAKEQLFQAFQIGYRALIRCLFERNRDQDHADAYWLAERSRGRALAELIAERTVDTRPGNPEQESLLEEERTLQAQNAANYRQLLGADPDAPSTAALRQQARRLDDSLERVREHLQAAFPEYADLEYPQPLDLNGTMAMLADDTMLLEYDASDGECFVWAVRRGRFSMEKLGADSIEIADLVERAVGAYNRDDDGGSDEPARREISALLLDPVPAEMWEGARRLIVVPDGQLHYLPFELLSSPGPGEEFLGDRHAISYSPSATVLEVVERTWAPGDYEFEFVGFGDPAFADEEDPSQEPRAAARAFRLAGKPIKRLPASGDEVETIAAEFGSAAEYHLREDATEHRARTRAPLARFVHFATHSLLDDQRPLNSGLVLAPPSDAELADDSGLDDMLQAFEMFSLRLSAEVVVCSACQTGLGTMRAGEGMVGMSRALFFAGARSVVVSLWPVQDEPTSELMQELYRHLRNGSPTAEALQAAREATRREWRDPRHWAGFIAIGPG